jgi:hypothetical protein
VIFILIGLSLFITDTLTVLKFIIFMLLFWQNKFVLFSQKIADTYASIIQHFLVYGSDTNGRIRFLSKNASITYAFKASARLSLFTPRSTKKNPSLHWYSINLLSNSLLVEIIQNHKY